jgi:predicted ribosomally synthesized peptide with nif11-like leader
MSVKMALEFIQQVRKDQALRQQLDALRYAADLQAVVRIGADAGFEFSDEELRTAFKHDWGMRWMFYGGGKSEDEMLASGESKDDGQSF